MRLKLDANQEFQLQAIEAIADYTRAIELDPNLAAAYYNRGVARAATGDPAGVGADFHRARELGYEP